MQEGSLEDGRMIGELENLETYENLIFGRTPSVRVRKASLVLVDNFTRFAWNFVHPRL